MEDQELGTGAEFVASSYKPPSLLPIARHKKSLLYLIEKYPVVIVVGQTGSGKTTQIPQFLYQAGWCADGKAVAVTQPRRVAATSVAARVAQELECTLGQEVGYSIRFEDVTSEATRIKFLTDGLLLREALVDPLLSRYSVIMVDEAHERSLSSDVLLGLLKKIRRRRPELRIIVSSATIQAEEFLKFFTNAEASETGKGPAKQLDTPTTDVATIVNLEGRMFPVDINYLEQPAENYLRCAVDTVLDIHTKEGDGDILLFLTGRNEIEEAIDMINERAVEMQIKSPAIQPLPLYAGLSTEQQMYVFEAAPTDTRKVIVATNIAEASVTIEGINFVVDCGFVKLRAYNPSSGIETLTSTAISKASANQRAGRAGRTKAGKCYRLYVEQVYDSMSDATPPEIQRSNLAPMILQMKALGIDNIARFDFLTSPPAELVIRALESLYSLGALDDYAKLTRPLGLRMAELSVEPMMAKVLLTAPSFGVLNEVLTIAAMTSLQGAVWVQHDGGKKLMETARRRFAVEEGDQLTLLNLYQAFVTRGRKDAKWCRDNYVNFKSLSRAVSIRNQLRRYLERFGVDVEESSKTSLARGVGEGMIDGQNKAEKIARCLTTGYFAHAAKMQADGSFKSVNGLTLHAHPSSLMFNRKAQWVVFHEVMETANKTYIRDITKIEKSWLLEYAPQFYESN
ncbi:P-loop containing nucleoside triphosphate hydrolase protein [Microthyrium microscopicum]|uniref:RNA helicase n=1 Tax=Microthyrium microscopicum TaxID=703497 RepID=A0A6A6UKT2_9PEZI|nr:P-loop containing nucleoside triphosphate hydrolase protein [Microthyrium microscopicum]